MEKQLQPKLRFPEFSGDWESKKLKDFSKLYSGGTPSKNKEEFWNGDIPWISASVMGEKYLKDSNLKVTNIAIGKGTRLTFPESILILVRGSMLFNKIPLGITKQPIAFNQDVKNIFTKENNEFLYYYFKNKENFILNNVTATGIGAGKIDTDFLENLLFHLPSLPEQQKIADYLTTIDRKIELLTEKKTELSRYKKAMMQKLFAQEIRFKDENGNDYSDWEVKKIKDLCTRMQSGGTPTASNRAYYENGDIPFLSISDMTDQGKYLTRTKKYINNDGLDNSSSWLVPKDSIIYSMYASVGFVSINKIEISTSQAVMNIILKSEYSIDYVYYFLNYFRKYIPKYIETGTQGNINAEIVKNIKVPIPSIEEQQKIANFLSAIDDNIAKVEEQIKETQNFKKAMLQQLFV